MDVGVCLQGCECYSVEGMDLSSQNVWIVLVALVES